MIPRFTAVQFERFMTSEHAAEFADEVRRGLV